MRHNKKGDLSLSINAIVILILAIVMLGLGLTFMRNIFGKAAKEFEGVGGEVQKQMIEQMKQTDKIVDINRPQIEIKIGQDAQLLMAFKDDGVRPMDFLINTTKMTNGTSLKGNPNNCDLGNTSRGASLEYKTSTTNVLPGAVTVMPLNIHVRSSALPDTCFYELKTDYSDTSTRTGTVTTEITVNIIS